MKSLSPWLAVLVTLASGCGGGGGAITGAPTTQQQATRAAASPSAAPAAPAKDADDNVIATPTVIPGSAASRGNASASPGASPAAAPVGQASPGASPAAGGTATAAPSASPAGSPSPGASPSLAPSASASPSPVPSASPSPAPSASPVQGASFTNSAGMVFKQIPAGTFSMGANGSPYANVAEEPTHQVTVSSFYMESTAVTYAQFTTVYNWALAHGYVFDNTSYYAAGYNPVGDPNQNPVVSVPWISGLKWSNALSEYEGRPPVYYADTSHTTVLRSQSFELTNAYVDWAAKGYRLPTEAEWEYAARAGATTSFWWGNDGSDTSNEWSLESTGGTHTNPVATKKANGFGLYDISGNVHVMTWDMWVPGSMSAAPATNPHGPDSGGWGARVNRGGSFLFNLTDSDPQAARAYLGGRRGVSYNIVNDFDCGLRVVLGG